MIKFKSINKHSHILYSILIIFVLVGHLCSNASFLVFNLLDIENELTELYLSEEGESEEENEELEEKDLKEYKNSHNYQISQFIADQNAQLILDLFNLKDGIEKEIYIPPPRS